MIGKARAAIVGLLQLVPLDHGAHRAVEDEDALLQQGSEFGGTVGLHKTSNKNPFGTVSERVLESVSNRAYFSHKRLLEIGQGNRNDSWTLETWRGFVG
jgi:hypothetical protein